MVEINSITGIPGSQIKNRIFKRKRKRKSSDKCSKRLSSPISYKRRSHNELGLYTYHHRCIFMIKGPKIKTKNKNHHRFRKTETEKEGIENRRRETESSKPAIGFI
uniref:Uncharacterized protein n=3 Tax=Opuntia streptacantha TaxID=393608 RepID=A0A7C8ZZH7_OPUST